MGVAPRTSIHRRDDEQELAVRTRWGVAKQHFKGPVGHVAGQDLHVHQYWPESAPPDDPAMSVQCWQCGRLTWRYTRHCVHCQVDLRGSMMARMVGRLKALIDGGAQ